MWQKQGFAAVGDTQLWRRGGVKDGDKEEDMKGEEREYKEEEEADEEEEKMWASAGKLNTWQTGSSDYWNWASGFQKSIIITVAAVSLCVCVCGVGTVYIVHLCVFMHAVSVTIHADKYECFAFPHSINVTARHDWRVQ